MFLCRCVANTHSLVAHSGANAGRATALAGEDLLLAEPRLLEGLLAVLHGRVRLGRVGVCDDVGNFANLGSGHGCGRARQALVVDVVEVGEVSVPAWPSVSCSCSCAAVLTESNTLANKQAVLQGHKPKTEGRSGTKDADRALVYWPKGHLKLIPHFGQALALQDAV